MFLTHFYCRVKCALLMARPVRLSGQYSGLQITVISNKAQFERVTCLKPSVI